MTFYRALSLFVLLLALQGCATPPAPFKLPPPSGNPTAARLSITSVMTENIFGRGNIVAGKVYVNGDFYGNFTKESNTFSMDLTEKQNFITVCPENKASCVQARLVAEPNKHYKFEYRFKLDYYVIAATYNWELVQVGVEDYKSAVAKPVARNEPATNLKATPQSQARMQAAKIECLDLGFKEGTESFGACILKLSNN